MKKMILIISILTIFSCNTVEDWREQPVLSNLTKDEASKYVIIQESYIELIRTKSEIDVKDNLSINELDKLLLIDKKIALSSKKLANSWFDFNLQLRQDPGFNRAYKGHYYFRKGIDALSYSEQSKKKSRDISIKESKNYTKVLLLEGECRLAIGQIVAYNISDLDTAVLYRDLKKCYRSMD